MYPPPPATPQSPGGVHISEKKVGYHWGGGYHTTLIYIFTYTYTHTHAHAHTNIHIHIHIVACTLSLTLLEKVF